MNNHTPGPWQSMLFKGDCFVIFKSKQPQEVICNLLTDSKEYPELKAINKETQRANTRLIVEAPEMYDNLCEVAYFLEQKSCWERDEFAGYARMMRRTLAQVDESKQEDIH